MEGIGQLWNIKQSQLYALLEKLERDGLILSSLIPGEKRPDRREFRLTDAGMGMLQEWISSPVQHARDMRQEFLARLYFARCMGRRKEEKLVRAQSNTCKAWLLSLKKQLDELPTENEFERVVFNFRIHQVEATIEWLNDYLDSH